MSALLRVYLLFVYLPLYKADTAILTCFLLQNQLFKHKFFKDLQLMGVAWHVNKKSCTRQATIDFKPPFIFSRLFYISESLKQYCKGFKPRRIQKPKKI